MQMQDTLYNIAFERSVLSSIIFEPALIEELGSVLKLDDFYLPAHRNIYEVMLSLAQADKPIDEEFIKRDLINSNRFDEQVLMEILIANPISNTKAYVDEVIDKSRLRKLVGLAQIIKKSALEEGNKSDVVISKVDSELNAIVEMNASLNDFGIISIDDVEDGKTEFILEDWLPIPRGTVTLISAPGGTGKSWTALQLAIRHSNATNKKCAVWLSEDPLFESKSRAKAICKDILHTDGTLKNIRLVSRPPIQLIQNKQFSHIDFYKFKKNFSDDDVIIFDPTLAFYGGEENDNSQARLFMQPFMNWAQETNKCIIFLHHSKKSSDGNGSRTRGAGAFVDAARTVYDINRVHETQESDMREFVLTKDNYGAIKYLKSFKVQRKITPTPMIAVHEKIYDSSLPFNGTKTNATPPQNDKLDMPGGFL